MGIKALSNLFMKQEVLWNLSLNQNTNLQSGDSNQSSDLGIGLGWVNENLQIDANVTQNLSKNDPLTYRTRDRNYDLRVGWQVAGVIPVDVSLTVSHVTSTDRISNTNVVTYEGYLTLSMPLEIK